MRKWKWEKIGESPSENEDGEHLFDVTTRKVHLFNKFKKTLKTHSQPKIRSNSPRGTFLYFLSFSFLFFSFLPCFFSTILDIWSFTFNTVHYLSLSLSLSLSLNFFYFFLLNEMKFSLFTVSESTSTFYKI